MLYDEIKIPLNCFKDLPVIDFDNLKSLNSDVIIGSTTSFECNLSRYFILGKQLYKNEDSTLDTLNDNVNDMLESSFSKSKYSGSVVVYNNFTKQKQNINYEFLLTFERGLLHSIALFNKEENYVSQQPIDIVKDFFDNNNKKGIKFKLMQKLEKVSYKMYSYFAEKKYL